MKFKEGEKVKHIVGFDYRIKQIMPNKMLKLEFVSSATGQWMECRELVPFDHVRRKKPTRRELKQQIKDLKAKLREHEMKPITAADIDDLCRATVKARIEELQRQLAEANEYYKEAEALAEKTIRNNDVVARENYEIKQQLADARKSMRIVEALEKMPEGWSLQKGIIYGFTIFDRTDQSQTQACATIENAIRDAGLLTESEAQNANTDD